MITKLRSSLLLNKFSLSAPEENVDNSMKNMPVADPDLELREGSTWFFVASALPAFLPSTILFSFTQNKGGTGAPRAPSLDSPLYAY